MPISRSTDIDAPAQQVWELVSDLPNMGRLSPENTGGSWRGGATGPTVGARFRGSNRAGIRRWSTSAVVTAAEPGKAFAFDVTFAGLKISHWAYDLSPREGGCTVTESWTDRRGALMKSLGGPTTGVADREAFTATSIEHTLAALKAAAES